MSVTSNITTATLAQKISDLVDAWRTFMGQLQTWLAGTVGGGPSNNGVYPLTDNLGNTFNVKCPAQLQADVNATITGSAASATNSANSATAAAASATAAAGSATNAANSATAAATSATNANTYQSQAATFKTNAAASAVAAAASAASCAASATDATNAHNDRVAADADAAAAHTDRLQCDSDAAAVAANLATLNATNYVPTVILSDPLDGGSITTAPATALFDCGHM